MRDHVGSSPTIFVILALLVKVPDMRVSPLSSASHQVTGQLISHTLVNPAKTSRKTALLSPSQTASPSPHPTQFYVLSGCCFKPSYFKVGCFPGKAVTKMFASREKDNIVMGNIK